MRTLPMLFSLILFTAFGNRPARAEDSFEQMVMGEARARGVEVEQAMREGKAAYDKGDFATAAQHYADAVAKAPGFGHALRRQCGAEIAQKHHARAQELCRAAVTADPTPLNTAVLADVLAQGDKKDEARDLAAAAFRDASDRDQEALVRVNQAALQAEDEKLFEDASRRLERVAPAHMATHYFAGLRAAMHAEWSDARDAFAKAKALGLPQTEYEAWIARIDEAEPWPSRVWPLAWRIGLGWLACLLFLLCTGSVLSFLTLHAARSLPADVSGQSSAFNLILRRAYAAVIGAACLFYYVSLPLVLIAVVGGAIGVLYGFMMLGRIPIKLVLILGLVALVSVWAVLKSVFIRARDADPGTRLDLQSEPGLRALLEEVAQKVGTRPVDSVYLTPGTDIAVFERGGMLQQIRGHSERCLVLGLGVLDGMRLGDLKAILAHEYGHFSNRDTAGGGLALAVRRSLIGMAQGLATGGAATWYNPAWWFFRGFFSVFLRVSQGASRLQEVLADRWAAFCYGSEAFVSGLTHVIDRSVRFDAQARVALSPGLEARRPLTNLYSHLRAAVIAEGDVSREVQEALERKPSPYDSHPAPQDRIAWVRALAAPEPDSGPESAVQEREAWSVFANREQLEWQMTQHVNQVLGLHHADVKPSSHQDTASPA